jgi:biopolymer transport protein TolR
MRVPGIETPHHGTQTTLAEINVTPMVDVMLVLLIIFMVSAPLMQQGVGVDLPRTRGTVLTEAPDRLTLTIAKNRPIQMNGQNLEKGTLYTRLQAIAAAKPGIEVFVQADQTVPYGTVAQVMAEARRAGITRVGLVTEAASPGEGSP